jgi:hypothetical protein
MSWKTWNVGVFRAAHGGHTAIELEDWKCAVFGRSWVPFPIRKTDVVAIREELFCVYRGSVRRYVCLEKAQCLAALRAVALFLSDVSTSRTDWRTGSDFTGMEGRQTCTCKGHFIPSTNGHGLSNVTRNTPTWMVSQTWQGTLQHLTAGVPNHRPSTWLAPWRNCPVYSNVFCSAILVTIGTEHRSTEHFVSLQNLEETVIGFYCWAQTTSLHVTFLSHCYDFS